MTALVTGASFIGKRLVRDAREARAPNRARPPKDGEDHDQ
jgi:hypothetical protein